MFLTPHTTPMENSSSNTPDTGPSARTRSIPASTQINESSELPWLSIWIFHSSRNEPQGGRMGRLGAVTFDNSPH
jgi:hypothetical protein